jgi:hypothetical protein
MGGQQEATTSLDDLEAYLRDAPIQRVWVGIPGPGGGHPNKRRLELAGGVYALAKLGDDDNGLRMVRCETAAWKLARLLEWDDLMAATVLREINLEDVGRVWASLQVIWPSFEWVAPLDRFPPEVIERAAAFDVITRMSDRSNNNWLGVAPPGEVQALKLIDHGHALTGQGAVGSSIVQAAQGAPELADETVMTLQRLAEEALISRLGDLVPPAVSADIAGRARLLAEAGRLILPDGTGV